MSASKQKSAECQGWSDAVVLRSYLTVTKSWPSDSFIASIFRLSRQPGCVSTSLTTPSHAQ